VKSEVLYMLTVIAVVFVVNYALRSLPFLFVLGRDRPLPSWVTRVGKLISPVVIAFLVIYAYAGLSWRTPWPLIAGFVTVALHLWKRNSLASIIAGTVVYMCLLNCGCTTASSEIALEARDPSIEVRPTGIYVDDERVTVEDIPDLLEDAGVPNDRTVHILVDEDVLKDLREARSLMGFLAINGYRRSVLVTKRHANSSVREKR